MNQKIIHRKPIAPMISKAAAQPQCPAIQGTVSGAKIAPTFAPELNIPVAKDRSFLGKYSAVAFIAAGKFPASPIANIVLENINPMTERSEEHTSELQSRENLVCRLLLEKKKKKKTIL